jgi:capsule polysaccharide export protein KpsE/RkpR
MMRDDVTKSNDLPVDALERPDHAIPGDVEFQRLSSSAKMLRLVWDQRKFIFRWVIYGFVLATLIAIAIPKKYTSVARLMPPDQTNSGMAMLAAAANGRAGSGLGAGLGSIAGDLLGVKSSGDLFVGILQSRTIQNDLINKFNLRKVYWDRYLEDAQRDLSKYTEISQDRKSGIITIGVTDTNPQRAAAMAQEYVAQLNDVVVLLNTSSAHREREFLEGRLQQVKQALESAENDFSDFASKNTALDIPAQGKAMIEAAATLEGQFIAAQTELESIKQVYADGNVRVRSTQARVDELRHQLQKIGGKFDSTIEPGAKDDQSMYPSIKKLPLLGVKYADLYRNTKVEETIFETLTQEYELAKVEEAKETLVVKVLDPPNIPEKKSYPPRLLIIVLGTMLACMGSVLFIFGNAYWSEIDSQDPNKVLVLEISQATRSHLLSGFANGAGNGHSNGHFWKRLAGKRSEVETRD